MVGFMFFELNEQVIYLSLNFSIKYSFSSTKGHSIPTFGLVFERTIKDNLN